MCQEYMPRMTTKQMPLIGKIKPIGYSMHLAKSFGPQKHESFLGDPKPSHVDPWWDSQLILIDWFAGFPVTTTCPLRIFECLQTFLHRQVVVLVFVRPREA